MSELAASHLTLSFPVYGSNARCLKRDLVNIATGGILKKSNRSSVVVTALDDISFHLKDGDRLGLVGHNGAGKSTLLKTLAGLYEPQHGSVQSQGKISSLLDIQVGMQPELSGYENIRIRCLLLGLTREAAQALIPDIEAFTELGNFLSMPVKTYSSGMLVRLAFGIATAMEPDILLIDEVFGAGDAQFMDKAERRMTKIIHQSNILVMASHSNELINRFCNKALWLAHGKIQQSGTAQEVIDAYTSHTAQSSSAPLRSIETTTA